MSEPTDVIQVNDRRITVADDPKRNKLPQEGEPIDRILALAIQQEAPLEQLEKWMDLKRQYEADEARKAYFKAVAAFRQENIVIKKDKTNSQFNSKYTSLGNLLETVGPFLGKHGLSYRFNTSQNDKMLTVDCILRHELGHTETVTLSAPPDTSGGNSKNSIQQIKSTFTYLRSATFEAVTGLSGTEASIDDDGNSAGNKIEFISTDQCTEIEDMINDTYKTDAKKKQWLDYMKASAVHEIPVDKYKMAINSLKRAQEGSKNNA